MSNERLNQVLRRKLCDKLIHSRLDPDVAEIASLRVVLADRAYHHLYNGDTLAKMQALPDGWLPERNQIRVAFGSDTSNYAELTFNGSFYTKLGTYHHHLGTDVPTIKHRFLDKTGGCSCRFDDDSVETTSWQNIRRRIEKLTSDYSELYPQIMAVLNSCTTSGKLVEIWPETQSFLKELQVEIPVQNLPAVKIEELNVRLGLRRAA